MESEKIIELRKTNRGMNEILNANRPLVISTIKKTCSKYSGNLNFDDIVSAGMVGLWKAATHFCPEKGRFSTIATACIKREMFRFIQKEAEGKARICSIEKMGGYDSNGSSFDDIFYQMIAKEDIRSIFQVMEKDDRDLLIARFWENKTLREMAKMYGVTRERVRQKIAEALKRIRAALS
ncbi:MAG: sigma-70 family RNA polymerase sigma factor [Patescibacteria group bacterium]